MYSVKYIDEEQWTDRCPQQYYVILNSKGYRIGQPFGDRDTAEAACRALNAAGDPNDRPQTQPDEKGKIWKLALVCGKRRNLCSNPDGTLKIDPVALRAYDDACQKLIRAILQD